MKNILYVFFHNTGKKGKKVCIDVIDMVKIWKNTGKIWKKTKKNFTIDFYQYFTIALSICSGGILPFYQFYHKKHTNKKKSFLGA